MLRDRRARRDQGRDSEPCHAFPHGGAGYFGDGNARTDEWQYLPLRRLFQYRRGDGRSRREVRMKGFTYERATSPADAASKAASIAGAKFIAGGTNLLDLMKL